MGKQLWAERSRSSHDEKATVGEQVFLIEKALASAIFVSNWYK
jgi:hypothetical protein